MKIFLAGATGAIGKLLTPLLLGAGHTVTGTTRSPQKFPAIAAAGAQPAALNVLDREATFAALREARPEAVINMLTDLAGLDFGANARLRFEGSRNLVDAAKEVGVSHMVAESIGWMYGAGPGPAHEDEPLDPAPSASRQNAVAAVRTLEAAVGEMPVGVILRYGILYGPGTWYARDALTGEQVRRGEIAANDAVTSFVHVADAAQAAFQALAWPSGPVNIVDDEPAPAYEWVPFYARLIGAAAPPRTPGGAAWERGASNAKAKTLGWRPQYPSWRAGFAEVLGLS